MSLWLGYFFYTWAVTVGKSMMQRLVFWMGDLPLRSCMTMDLKISPLRSFQLQPSMASIHMGESGLSSTHHAQNDRQLLHPSRIIQKLQNAKSDKTTHRNCQAYILYIHTLIIVNQHLRHFEICQNTNPNTAD